MTAARMDARSRCRTAPNGSNRGFTLIEVVVALAILSLVMLATITGLRTLASTQTTLERMTGRVDEVRTVSSFLRDALASAIVSNSNSRGRLSLGGSSRESTFFEFSPESLAWKSTVLFGEGYGGSHLVQVAREQNQLILRWQEQPAQGRPVDWAAAASRVLVEELDDFKVSYRRSFADDWRTDWDRGGAPALVRLQLRSSGRYWPVLIFRVQGTL